MLKLSLKTLEKTLKCNPEIIIVANNNDYSEIDINLDPDKYILYKIKKNLFWPGAINFGALKANGDYLVFCDPDVFYLDNWLEELKKCFFSNRNIGAASSKIINPLTNRIMDFGMAYSKYNVIHTTKGLMYNHPITMNDRIVQAACGAVFFTSKNVFNSVGGIDESMPYIYCDNDYSIKLSSIGLDTYIAAKSVVYHKGDTDNDNSKYYAFSYLREDSKAAFYGKNSDKRKIDFGEWIEYFWNWYLKNTSNRQDNYILLNLSTVLDFDLYQNIFTHKLKLNILDNYNFVIPQRNIVELQLYKYVSVDIIDIAVPFIYFVDSFTSLFNNQIWFNLRNTERDIVIDKHGNIINFSDIVTRAV
jgi:GT2 family glycosyltransferase